MVSQYECHVILDEAFSADIACGLLARIGEQDNIIAKLEKKISSQDESIRNLERQMNSVKEQMREKHHP